MVEMGWQTEGSAKGEWIMSLGADFMSTGYEFASVDMELGILELGRASVVVMRTDCKTQPVL